MELIRFSMILEAAAPDYHIARTLKAMEVTMLFWTAHLAPRAAMSAIFLWSGSLKVLAPGETIGFIGSVGMPYPDLAFLGAVVLELGAGAALLFGYRVKASAFLLALFSLVTAVIFHNAAGGPDQLVHFMKNVAIAGGLISIGMNQPRPYGRSLESASAFLADQTVR
jgi:putative oxidoreductase